jgi:hypothetical protein
MTMSSSFSLLDAVAFEPSCGAVERVLETAHDVAFCFAENALHAIAFSTIIRWQHAIWVLQLEPSLFSVTKKFGNAADHGILGQAAVGFPVIARSITA